MNLLNITHWSTVSQTVIPNWTQSYKYEAKVKAFSSAHSDFYSSMRFSLKCWSVQDCIYLGLKTRSKMSQNKISKNESIAQQLYLVQFDINRRLSYSSLTQLNSQRNGTRG